MTFSDTQRAELSKLISAWPRLPDEVKSAILLLPQLMLPSHRETSATSPSMTLAR
jgi:hypothetical protein